MQSNLEIFNLESPLNLEVESKKLKVNYTWK